MNVQKVINEFNKKYPGRNIIENKNSDGITTEILCELDDNTTKNKDQSLAIAVIDSSTIHYHKVITETYKVLKGKLTIFKYDDSKKKYDETTFNEGDEIKILPGEIHSNIGDETWVEVVSTPAWFIEDYYNLEVILKKYLERK